MQCNFSKNHDTIAIVSNGNKSNTRDQQPSKPSSTRWLASHLGARWGPQIRIALKIGDAVIHNRFLDAK